MFAVSTALMLATALQAQTASPSDAILLEFSSAHCPPCQAMKPVLAQVQQLGTPVRHVDVLTEPHLAARYGVRSTPTFVVLRNGKEVTRLVGTQTLAQLQTALKTSNSGPLVDTGSKSVLATNRKDIPAPQTRLAPIGGPPSNAPQTLVTTTPKAARSEAMPSVSLADAVERARAATVRLRVFDGHGYGAGTGTIVDTHGEEALVLTCGHLFRDTDGKGKVEVDLYVGGQVKTVNGQVVDYDADTRDIALVAIRPGFAVQPVRLVGDQQTVRNGQTAFSFGCDRGDDPSRRDTRITGVNKYNQHLGVSNLEISGAPIDGRSGGGLFDESGVLIGVCNAADYKEDVGIYAGPGSVHWQLDRVGLSRLYKSGNANAAAPPERIASLADAPTPLPTTVQQPSALTDVAVSAEPAVRTADFVTPAAMTGAIAQAGAATVSNDQEVIVIVRDRANPTANSRVMTIAQPTSELMNLIQQHSR